MLKKCILLILGIGILSSASGCTNNMQTIPKEIEYKKIDIWNIGIILPSNYEIKELTETPQNERLEIYFTNDENHKKDDYILMENRLNITSDDLFLDEAEDLLMENVSKFLENENYKELLSLTEFVYRSIPGISCEFCDEKYNYRTYYFFDTTNNIVKIEYAHDKEGDDNVLTESFEKTINSLEFSSWFKQEEIIKSSGSSTGSKCVNCGGLGYVKQYYGSSWLDAFLAGEPNYELIKCPLCHGTGKTSN